MLSFHPLRSTFPAGFHTNTQHAFMFSSVRSTSLNLIIVMFGQTCTYM